MNKNALKSFAVRARQQMTEDIRKRAYRCGITENAEYITSEINLSKAEEKLRSQIFGKIKEKGYNQVVEEAAYIWFIRFAALYFMEINGFLPNEVRLFDGDRKQDNEELYKYLLISRYRALGAKLPHIFEKEPDWTELLIPENLLGENSMPSRIVRETAEEDWTEGVEIIGWLYQYYISQEHNSIVNIYKGTVKKDDIPAATQLFTPEWIVKYIVDNSLGRYWIERNPKSRLREKLHYFTVPKSGDIRFVNEDVNPKNLTFFDPCMGSGHILVYAFDVLMEIYKECGYSACEAAAEIVKNNLFGTDIDDRCFQLACFAVMMKALAADSKFLEKEIQPNLLSIKESNTDETLTNEGFMPDKALNNTGKYLEAAFENAKEIGSLIKIEDRNYTEFINYLEHCAECNFESEEFTQWKEYFMPKLRHMAYQAKILSQKYTLVCTNPPYLNKYDTGLREYISSEYRQFSGDLFSVFMIRCFDFCIENGYTGFMTPMVWMFIKSYENLRRYIIENKFIVTLTQMEYSAFEDAAVPVCAFVMNNGKHTEKSLFIRLAQFKGGMKTQEQKLKQALKEKNCPYLYEIRQGAFLNIPGCPIAYWANEKITDVFRKEKRLSDIAEVKIGMGTGKNDVFVRRWWEVQKDKIDFSLSHVSGLDRSEGKWFPYNKGGDYRLWYGNLREIVWYDKEGRAKMKATPGYRENGGYSSYFREGITWTFISSSNFGVRYRPFGSVFDVAGSQMFTDRENLHYLLALLSSKVSGYILEMLNPTMNFQAGNIKNMPVLFGCEEKAGHIAEENTELSKEDWDCFETSWDFKRHPLI